MLLQLAGTFDFLLQMISEAFHRPKNVEVKSGPNDLVTETDKAVEKMVFSAIHEKFPTHK